MPEDLGDRTEAATPRKVEDARQRGQIARSADFSAAIDLIAAAAVLVMLGTFIGTQMADVMRRCLGPELVTTGSAGMLARSVLARGAIAVAPVLAIVFVVALATQLLQVGFVFTGEPLRPKLSRLNPVAGLARLFERRNLAKTLVSTVKLVVVMAISGYFLWGVMREVIALPVLSLWAGVAAAGDLGLRLALWLLALLLFIGAADWLYQRWQHGQDLKMTKEEVKDERRSMEGDPQMKARRQRLARQIALQRINQSVPRADVIVTNPTHFAVAIRYDETTMTAPRVVAKGADLLAARIRQVGAMHAIPIVERPPLARALYAGVEVGRDVPPEMYQAVAEVLAYVYRLEAAAA